MTKRSPSEESAGYGGGGKNDPEAEAFMTEFCKTIGNHFTAMGAQNQEKVPAGPAPSAGPLADEAVKRAGEKAKSKTPPAPPSPEDEAQVQKVLQNMPTSIQ